MNHFPTTHVSLLSRLADREDRLAWEEFSRLYSPVLYRVAAGSGLQGLDADELVQEVLIAVMQAMENFEHGGKRGSFRRWLLTIAKNTTINKICRRPLVERIRDTSVELQQLSDVRLERVERELESEWQSELFVSACQAIRNTLQPMTWAAFWKTAVEDQDASVVAKELGMTVGAVYVARSRTLAKLKAWVQSNSALWEGAS